MHAAIGRDGGDDDDEVRLPADTQALVDAFLSERTLKEKSELDDGRDELPDEDWQLSQFWYSTDTIEKLTAECLVALQTTSHEPARLACLCTPSLMPFINKSEAVTSGRVRVTLFEYDTRFAVRFPDQFVQYDYREPRQVPETDTFDMVIADPPFLSEECLCRVAQTIRCIAKQDAKILLCTGAIQEELARRLLATRRLDFRPEHANNLSNDFAAFANYDTFTMS